MSAAAFSRQTQVLINRGWWDAGVAQATLLRGRGNLEERKGRGVAELRFFLRHGGGGADGPRGREEDRELSMLAQPAGVNGRGATAPGGRTLADAKLGTGWHRPEVPLLTGVGTVSQLGATALELMEGKPTQNQRVNKPKG